MSIEIALSAVDVTTLGSGVADRARMAKLTDGAHQFEAMMLTEMLKGLNFSGAPDEGGQEPSGGASSTITGYGTEALAKAISQGGGFGLAKQIVRQVTAEDNARGKSNSAATGSKVS